MLPKASQAMHCITAGVGGERWPNPHRHRWQWAMQCGGTSHSEPARGRALSTPLWLVSGTWPWGSLSPMTPAIWRFQNLEWAGIIALSDTLFAGCLAVLFPHCPGPPPIVTGSFDMAPSHSGVGASLQPIWYAAPSLTSVSWEISQERILSDHYRQRSKKTNSAVFVTTTSVNEVKNIVSEGE